jgi:hypothetical protein
VLLLSLYVLILSIEQSKVAAKRVEDTKSIQRMNSDTYHIATKVGDELSSKINNLLSATFCKNVTRSPVSEIRPDLTAEQKQEIDFDALTRIGSGESG